MEKKFIIAQKMESIDDENSIVGWASKPTIDRDKELILSSAWKLDGYKKNPVVVLAHNYNELPIGKCIWIKATDQGLRFKAKFANTERGKEVYQLYKDGILSCFSVGFSPRPGGVTDHPVDVRYKGVKRLFTDVDLLEISCVSIPSNQDAVIDQTSFIKYVRDGRIVTKQLKNELEGIIEIIEKGSECFELEIITKADISVEEIKCAIEMELNKDHGSSEPSSPKNPWYCVERIYPVSFPESGYAIVQEYIGMRHKMYKVDYTFDVQTRMVMLANKVEVEPEWKPVEETKVYEFDNSEIVAKIETTENYIHIPAPGEEGEHKDHKIRTITLSKKEGIKGKYCVDDKLMIGYMFDIEKWDEEKAKKWIEDHKKSLFLISIELNEDEIEIKGLSVDEDGDVLFQATKSSMMPEDEEEMDVFMDRCMADESMMRDYPEDEPRRDACKIKWGKKGEKGKQTIEMKPRDELEDFMDAISVLKKEIETLKKQMPDVPSSSPELGFTKTADVEGNPSLYDLTSAISLALNDSKNIMQVNERYWCNVVDIYPVSFPSGHVVYSSCKRSDEREFYRIDYSYIVKERKVVLLGKPSSVLQSWVEDRYGETEIMTMSKEEDIVKKEGRILSEMNRQMLSECMDQMNDAIQALKNLIAATEKKPKEEQSLIDLKSRTEDGIEGIETKGGDEDFYEFEEETLEIDEDVLRSVIESSITKHLKMDVKEIVTAAVARRVGRVVGK